MGKVSLLCLTPTPSTVSSTANMKRMYPHIYPSPFGEWCLHRVKWLTCYHPFLNWLQALPIMFWLSYNLKHAKKATTSAFQLEPQSLITHPPLWWNLKESSKMHTRYYPLGLTPFTNKCWDISSFHPVILPEHVQPNLEWGLLSIRLGRGDRSPHLKRRKDHSLSSSYCPICITNCVCKLLKRMGNSRLLWTLESQTTNAASDATVT
jgi:hypothetical protein